MLLGNLEDVESSDDDLMEDDYGDVVSDESEDELSEDLSAEDGAESDEEKLVTAIES